MGINKHLIISGTLFTIVLFLWPILMGLFPPKGNEVEQLQWIQNNEGIYKTQFTLAFLIAPAIIYLMFAQLKMVDFNHSLMQYVGIIFLSAYLILVSISYASQVVLVPKLLLSDLNEQAELWHFNASNSISYFMNQMGYFFWSMGSMILFLNFFRNHGTIKYISITYTLSALLSILAFIGLLADNKVMNSLTLFSGLSLVPVGILTIIWGIKEKNTYS